MSQYKRIIKYDIIEKNRNKIQQQSQSYCLPNSPTKINILETLSALL